jgi:magnesium transporter
MPQPLDERARQAMTRLLLPDLERAIDQYPEEARLLFDDLHPADGADLFAALDEERQTRLVQQLSIESAAGLLSFVEPTASIRVLRELPSSLTADILEQMESDDRAVLLARLDEAEQSAVLSAMETEEREEAVELLGHEEETAGRLMNTEFLTVPETGRVRDALEAARRGAREGWAFHSLYVVDATGRLKGRLALREVLAADPDLPVAEIADPEPPSVGVDVDQEEVARIISRYDLFAIPVIEENGVLVGIVTVDDVVDVLIQESTEDVQMLGAVQPLENPYLETSFWTLARKRALWLLVLFVVTMFTGNVLEHSGEVIARTLSLVLFIPLITSTGGNTGAQSSSLLIRALAIGEIRRSDVFRIGMREIAMGLFLGAFLGVLGFWRAIFWESGQAVAWVVALTLVGVCVFGSFLGAMLPILLERIKVDPAIASSPFVASIVDVSGILLYMAVATVILG